MFSRLRIKNFKGWRDTGEIRLAPLTVFFGSNSSGKSSLLQFLLMLKQTAESPDRRRVLHAGDSNTMVDLGTYSDLVSDHDVLRRLEFQLSWILPQTLTVKDPLHRSGGETTYAQMSFGATIASDERGTEQHVASMRYELGSGENSLAVAMETRDGAKYKIEASNYKLVRAPGRAWQFPSPVRFYGFPDEVGAYHQNAKFTSDLALELEKQLQRIQYLGPLREHPERRYIWSGENPEHVGWRGERAVEAMLAARDRMISPGKHKKGRKFDILIAEWLQRLGLLESFQVRPIAKDRKDYEVLVKTKGSAKEVALPDVGFGVSQILPVLIESFYAPGDTTILMEQPEIHLHPRVQSGLADLFIEAVRSRQDGHDRNIQLMVESHSEHFLRRLQTRIAEGKIKPEEVALYFAEAGENGAKLKELNVNLFGEIENWPDDFFGDEMGELAARMRAAAEREPVNK